jgi:soluble lytic murein transglycosylase-like protein
MKSAPALALLGALFALPQAAWAQAPLAHHPEVDKLVTTHAKANAVPEALVHRVIVRESKYQPHLVGRGGTIGLMQIKLGTARGLGYAGTAEELRDPDTNLMYGVKYLAGAYRAANGDHDRAVRYYAKGYYYVAKQQAKQLAMNRIEIVPLPRSRPSVLADAFWQLEAASIRTRP